MVVSGCQHASRSTGPDVPGGQAGAPEAPPPTPTPPPSPTPAQALGCGLPPGGGSGAGCPYLDYGAFNEDVNRAIAQAQNEHPELFDFNDGYGMLSWKVLDRRKYYDTV